LVQKPPKISLNNLKIQKKTNQKSKKSSWNVDVGIVDKTFYGNPRKVSKPSKNFRGTHRTASTSPKALYFGGFS
jgi:hypothetical protein